MLYCISTYYNIMQAMLDLTRGFTSFWLRQPPRAQININPQWFSQKSIADPLLFHHKANPICKCMNTVESNDVAYVRL